MLRLPNPSNLLHLQASTRRHSPILAPSHVLLSLRDLARYDRERFAPPVASFDAAIVRGVRVRCGPVHVDISHALPNNPPMELIPKTPAPGRALSSVTCRLQRREQRGCNVGSAPPHWSLDRSMLHARCAACDQCACAGDTGR
jgi:hypothetical protein